MILGLGRQDVNLLSQLLHPLLSHQALKNLRRVLPVPTKTTKTSTATTTTTARPICLCPHRRRMTAADPTFSLDPWQNINQEYRAASSLVHRLSATSIKGRTTCPALYTCRSVQGRCCPLPKCRHVPGEFGGECANSKWPGRAHQYCIRDEFWVELGQQRLGLPD